MDAIQIVNVSKKFKERGKSFFVLNRINLNIKKGEIFGFLGPNGAGKTTLLSIILGILYPDEGKVIIMGQDVHKKREIMEKINYVSGETRFHWVLTVRDVLNFYGMSYGISREKLKKRIKMLLDFFGITHIAHRKFDSLSTGERMRLVFAKALLNEPEILLFDEPTLGLDPQIANKVRKEIKRVNEELRTTILLTSHYMQEVESLCHRIAFINKGRIIDTGSVEKVKRKRFSSYDLIIKVREIKDQKLMEKMGFKLCKDKVHINVSYHDDLNKILSFFTENGYKIVDIQIKKPTLEDYFVSTLDTDEVVQS